MKLLAFEVWDDDCYEHRIVGPVERLRMWREELKRRKRSEELRSERRAEAQQIIDMSPLIAMLDPDTSAFQTMLSKLPLKSGAVVEWLEDELFPRFIGGQELWGVWDWDDSPRKPLCTMTLSGGSPQFGGGKPEYGMVVRNTSTGEALRFVGGQTWERG